MKINELQIPTLRQQTAIVGRNGSGKTHLGAWVLSLSAFDRQPFIIVNYKHDELLASIERARTIGFNEIPTKPGVYQIFPRPDEDEEMEAFLWKIWERGHTGLMVDESYLLPDKGAFRTILTQGRSLHIPRICLSQRPVDVSRFVFTEADHVAVFHLNDERDKDTIRRFTPKGFLDYVPPKFRSASGEDDRLPDYHCHWYDIKRHKAFVMAPVPPVESILQRLHDRLQPPRRTI